MNTTAITLGTRSIGANHPCFIIAEFGSNHDGSLERAKKLIDLAAQAGADAVKFQQFHPDDIIVKEIPEDRARELYPIKEDVIQQAPAIRYTPEGKKVIHHPFYDLLTENQFKDEWTKELSTYAAQKCLIFFSSVWDKKSIDLCEEAGVQAYKIGSGDLTNLPVITYAASKQKPIIIATGMAFQEEIDQAIAAIKSTGNNQIAILHGVISYPCAPETINLKYLLTLQERYPHIIGFSDNGVNDNGISKAPSLAAVALGAKMLEQHVTISRELTGPDHNFALTFEELKELIKEIRTVEKTLGTKEYVPGEWERKRARRARRCAYTITQIKTGETITESMFKFLRPAWENGLEPKDINSIIGRKATRHLQPFELITKGDIE